MIDTAVLIDAIQAKAVKLAAAEAGIKSAPAAKDFFEALSNAKQGYYRLLAAKELRVEKPELFSSLGRGMG